MIADSKALTDHCRGYTTSETSYIREEKEQLESKTAELRIDCDEELKEKFKETNIESDENKWF
jgi:hypothetical protein